MESITLTKEDIPRVIDFLEENCWEKDRFTGMYTRKWQELGFDDTYMTYRWKDIKDPRIWHEIGCKLYDVTLYPENELLAINQLELKTDSEKVTGYLKMYIALSKYI